MAKDSTAVYDPRQLWAANLAPLVVAAREGAAHAARTAGRQRARSRQKSQWWRQRWVIVAGAGLVIAGAAGGAYAATARRRSSTANPTAEQSTAEAGRNKVAGLARTVAHKFRGNGGDGDGQGDGQGRLPGSEPAGRPAMAASTPDESRNDARPY